MAFCYPIPITDYRPCFSLTLNGEAAQPCPNRSPWPSLIDQLGYDRRRIAVEVNREVVPLPAATAHPVWHSGDAVEIVTLVGGGSQNADVPADKPLVRR